MATRDRSFRIIGDFISAQSKQYLGSAATFLISTYLAVNSSPGWARTIALSSSIFSVGYGISTATSSRRFTHFADSLRQDFDNRLNEAENAQQGAIRELIDKHQAVQTEAQERIEELDASHAHLETNYETAKTELREAIEKLTAAHHTQEALQAQVEVFRQQFNAIRADFDRDLDGAKKLLNARAHQIINDRQTALEAEFQQRSVELHKELETRIKKFKAAYIERQQFWIGKYQDIETQYAQLNEQWQQHFQAHIDRYEELIADFKKQLEGYHPEIQEIAHAFEQREQDLLQQAAAAQAERDRLHNIILTPREFSGSQSAAVNGNKIVKFLKERNIIVDPVDARSFDGFDIVWIRPRSVECHEVEKHAEAIQRRLSLLKEPEISVGEEETIRFALYHNDYDRVAPLPTAPQPEFTAAETAEELQADKIIQYLYDNGIIVERPVVRTLPNNIFHLTFSLKKFERGTTASLSERKFIQEYAEAHKLLENSLVKGIPAILSGCKTLPKVELGYNKFILKVDVSGINWEAQAKIKKEQEEIALQSAGIVERSPTHFVQFVRSAPHVGIFGGTRFGKTVLMNNIIGVMFEIFGADAKLIVGDSKISESLKALKPQFLGAEECLEMLRQASDEVLKRSALRKQDVRQDRPMRSFEHDKRIYLLDEINEVFTRFNNPVDPADMEYLKENGYVTKNTVTTYLLRIWRMGAELGVGSLVTGQNLMASVIKGNIIDLDNCSMIFLGGAIGVGIKYRSPAGPEQSQLTSEYTARRKRYSETKEPEHRYYALYAKPGEVPYFSALPKPEEYTSDRTQTAIAIAPEDDPANDEFDNSGTIIQDIETDGEPEVDDGGEPTASQDDIDRLESLWRMETGDRPPSPTTEEHPPENPLAPEITSELIDRVVSTYMLSSKQAFLLEKIWGIKTKSGTDVRYMAARWKLRKILHDQQLKLPGSAWGRLPDDALTFDQVIEKYSK